MISRFAGELAVLNVGDGDTKLSFDPKNPRERARANRIVTDMLRRGYGLMVQVGEKDGEPLYQRVKKFDAKTSEYIIGFEPEGGDEHQGKTTGPSAAAGTEGATPAAAPGEHGRRLWERRIPASSTRAVAISRSAGG